MASPTILSLIIFTIMQGALADDDVTRWRTATITLAALLAVIVVVFIIGGFYLLLRFITPNY